MLLALTSWKGSPGVTTAALALAYVWPQERQVIVAECDPLGGEILAGYGRVATSGGRGVPEMMLHVRGGRAPLDRVLGEHLVALDADRRRLLLPGVARPQEAAAVPWDQLASVLSAVERADVLADCGRLCVRGAPAAVWRAADLTVLLLAASTQSVYAVHRSEHVLRGELGITGRGADGVVAVVVGPGGQNHDAAQIDRYLGPLGIPVVGELAWDPGAAAVLSRGEPPKRRFMASRLMRDAAELVDVLARRALERRAWIAVPVPSVTPFEPERGA